ncbi:hypothetical protein [Streptomyces sp. NBC_00582]|uniref:hypothetical protein n=1 Tax=Streptomyces sp. NBC_00582 TaxID=2975783 RepID=UPI002E81D16F|nr:hypothetical protein [Streptomyces sp. NBC_00582]WUB59570.1 hypothetical protein OG852_03755 [Streptomyces sp. NBC_00582]
MRCASVSVPGSKRNFEGAWPAGVRTPHEEALAPVARSVDPVERVAFACEFLQALRVRPNPGYLRVRN